MKPGRLKPEEKPQDNTVWYFVATFAIVVLVIGALQILAVMRTFAAGPEVGDIVAFHPVGAGIDEEAITVAYAAAPTDRTCVLSPRVMRAAGGSMIVEQRAEAGNYRVHWAGTRTNDGPGDCGVEADLSISVDALRALASATGQLAPDGRIATKL